MARLLLAALVLVAALGVLMVWSQDEIIFPTGAVPPAGPIPPGSERVTLETAGGERLHGLHVPPSIAVGGPRILVLGFGGNAWNGDDVGSYLHELYPQAHVVAFHYRGYRPSTGRPSAEALVADAPLVRDLAVERVEPDRVIAVGFSIGSAVAAALARSRKVDGLILVTPFDSLSALARSLYPWLPGGLLPAGLSAADDLAGSQVPVAIIAAEKDEIVLPERTDSLRRALPNLVFDRTIAGAGHNDIYARAEFHQAMDEALAEIARR